MFSLYSVEVVQSAKSFLGIVLLCSMASFMLCFIHAMATANVHAINCCFLSLFLTFSTGGAYIHLTLIANKSPWGTVLDVITLVTFIGVVVCLVWSFLRACNQIFNGAKIEFMPSEEFLLKKEAQLNEREKMISKREEEVVKQEEELKKAEERTRKGERAHI